VTKVRHDRFVPIRKSDMLDALIERGALAADAERRTASFAPSNTLCRSDPGYSPR
jgi:hypothetical protein